MTLFLALGKAEEATVLLLQFRMARLRYAYAELKTGFMKLDGELTALPSQMVSGVSLLVGCLEHVTLGASGSSWGGLLQHIPRGSYTRTEGDGIAVVPAAKNAGSV